MSQQCTNCAALAKVIQQQQQEINRLKEIIGQIESYCLKILNEANKVLKSKGHPKGVWAYNRGAKEAIEPIVEYLD